MIHRRSRRNPSFKIFIFLPFYFFFFVVVGQATWMYYLTIQQWLQISLYRIMWRKSTKLSDDGRCFSISLCNQAQILKKLVFLKNDKDEDTCDDIAYRAAINSTSKFKNLDETGMMLASCRHGCVLTALNMFSGENYRYVHYVQNEAFKKNVKFFCYDVACRYKPFVERIGKKIPEFLPLSEKMTLFLSLMHGKTHVDRCKVWFVIKFPVIVGNLCFL